MRQIVNAGAVELIQATIAAGATPDAARKWWVGELARHANEAGVDLASLAVSPEHVAELQRLVDDGTLNDKLARAVLEGVLAGEGAPGDVARARGLAVVSDAGALTAAVDQAIEAHPEVAAKVRDGKVAAAGVLVGAVMKTTGGQADAKTVRELILRRLS
jgi:aspartyl-tRNA(Asn)/glutamyl-tRNA(Gln) amidotransferase subunit B